MLDLSRLEEAETSLMTLTDSAWTQLRDSLKKILPDKVNDNNSLLDLVQKKGGWMGFSAYITEIASHKTMKKGSKNEVLVKNLNKFSKDMFNKQQEVSRLRQSNSGDNLEQKQALAIQKIRNGESIILYGPPGSGKTHVALYTLDVLASRKVNDLTLYTAPTSELALQSFCNLAETFPNVSIGIVCPLVFHMSPNPSIIVGTPCELWVYLVQTKLSWSKLIIDEVHTISNKEMGYSDALYYLTKGLRFSSSKTLVALSATVNDKDKKALGEFLCEASGIDNIQSIELDATPIPIREYHINNNAQFLKTKPSEQVCTSPELLFRIFKRIGHDGTLLFTHEDIGTWRLFEDMLLWLENKNDEYYEPLLCNAEKINKLILKAQECKEEVSRLEHIKGNSENVAKQMRIQEGNETKVKQQAIQLIADILVKEWNSFQKQGLPDFYEIATESDVRVATVYGIRDLEEGDEISLTMKHILQDILAYSIQSETVPMISSIGPYFALVDPKRRIEEKEFEAFCQMNVSQDQFGKEVIRIQTDNEKQWSAVNGLIRLSKAEGVPISEIKPIIHTMVKGFSYGIGLMSPSLPFVVTQTLRKLLNERRIPFLFASSELAVGISYPLRNVIIIGHDHMKPSLIIQMKGRCGRRGFDSDGRVIYINCEPQGGIEKLTLDKPASQYPESSVCCMDQGLDDVLHDIRTSSGLSNTTCEIILPKLRSTVCSDEQIKAFLSKMLISKSEQLNQSEREIACNVLQAIRDIQVGCLAIHRYSSCEQDSNVVSNIKHLSLDLKRVNSNVVNYCF